MKSFETGAEENLGFCSANIPFYITGFTSVLTFARSAIETDIYFDIGVVETAQSHRS